MTNFNQREFSRALIDILRELTIHQLNMILGASGHDPYLQWTAQASLGMKQHQSEDGWVFRYQVTNKLSGKIIADIQVTLGNDGSLVAIPLP